MDNLLLFHTHFFNSKFLYAIADYKLNGILRPYMRNYHNYYE